MKVQFTQDWYTSIGMDVDDFHIPAIGSKIASLKLYCEFSTKPKYFDGKVIDVRLEYDEKTLKLESVEITLDS